MLLAFNHKQPKNISSLANHAFGFQTHNISKARILFLDEDVQAAYVAFQAFEKSPSDNITVNDFLEAAQKCASNDRTGFADLVDALEQKINASPSTIALSASSSYSSNPPKI